MIHCVAGQVPEAPVDNRRSAALESAAQSSPPPNVELHCAWLDNDKDKDKDNDSDSDSDSDRDSDSDTLRKGSPTTIRFLALRT